MIGQTISHYRILEKLGEGGMGVVYLAEDTRLGRKVALKALSPAFARDPSRRQRFQQEARAAASLSHPGIAAVYEMEEVGEDLYIVFEYVPGVTLRSVLAGARQSLDTLLDIACDIAQALAAAHAHGIIHRDLKPENILRTPEGDTKILDFGLARFEPSALDSKTASARLTDPGGMVGTVAYMSPEQLEGKEVDFRSDIFSFGVMLYELATGVRPFEGGSPASTIANILAAAPVPLLERNPLAPAELERIVRKCLRKRADERYQSTKDLAVDLENLRRDSGEMPRPAAGDLEAEEPSLLARALGVFGHSPRRWWELQHLGAVFAFFPLYLYVAWKVRTVLVGTDLSAVGTWSLMLIVGLVLCAAESIALRGYLLVTGAFNPRGLPQEVRRTSRALHGSTLGFMGLLAVMAAFLLPFDTSLGTLALGLAVFGGIVSLVMEPTIDRAAFPHVYSDTEAPKPSALDRLRELTPRTWWTVNHLGAVLLFYPVFLYLAWQAHQQVPGDVLLTSFQVMLACGAVSVTIRVYLLGIAGFNPSGLAAGVRRVARPLRMNSVAFWGTFIYLARLLMTHAPAAAGLAVVLLGFGIAAFNVALFVEPAIDRLAFPGGTAAPEVVATEKARAKDPTKLHLVLILLLQLLFYVPVFVLAGEATFGAGLEIKNLLQLVLSLGGFAVFLGAGISGSITVELLRGKQAAARSFDRWFILFVLLDVLCLVLYFLVGAGDVHRIPVPVALTIIATVFAARFYQRQLARKLLTDAAG